MHLIQLKEIPFQAKLAIKQSGIHALNWKF
jgi:hypothetical protein